MNMHAPGRKDLPRITRMVYDHHSGKVLHIHQVMVLPAVQGPTEDTIDAEALRAASKSTGRSESELSVLRVPTEEVQFGTAYAVDLTTKRLVSTRLENGGLGPLFRQNRGE